MKNQKILIELLILFISFFPFISYSQIGGLSASKLGALSADPVSHNLIEFEPFFGYSSSQHHFNSEGKLQPLFSTSDSTMKFSGSGLRFTYGLFKNMEIGLTVPIDISEVRFGVKYKIQSKSKHRIALIFGYNNIVGNQIYVRRNSTHEATPSFLGGWVASFYISEKCSIDWDAQYQKHTIATLDGHTQGFYASADIGYYFFEHINFILGLQYNTQFYDFKTNNSCILSLNAGIVIEKAKNFILVVNAPFDLYGKNEYRTKGFGMALTIILD